MNYKLVFNFFFDVRRVHDDFKNVTLHLLFSTNIKYSIIVDIFFEFNQEILTLTHILIPLIIRSHHEKSFNKARRR